MKCRRTELLVFIASKEVQDGEICIIGQGIPMTAGAIAKRLHAPNATILTEAGMVDIDLFQSLEDVGDPGATIGFSYSIDLFDVFTTIVNRGYADVSILGAAQVDKFGNINSTIVGDYFCSKRSDFKLSGSGGANEFAGHSKRVVITLAGGEFVEKLDYMTSPGWLTGSDAREKKGLPGGPSAVVSPYGLFRFHPDSKELYLAGIFPQTTIEQVQQTVPWSLKTAEDFGYSFETIDTPTEDQIKLIREFEPFMGISGNTGRRLQSKVLPFYYQMGRSVL
jgi:glutaconate CoA-transferase subunit B